MAIGGSNPSRAAQPTASGVCALVVVLLAATLSWADEPSAKPDPRVGIGLDNDGVNPYSKLSNEQLGTLAGTFEELDRDQRRWFLTEVRKRMSAKGDRPQIQVDKDDRFGRVVRKVGRANQVSRDTRSRVGSLPSREENAEATKVYGTGVRPQREETPDDSTSTLQSKDPYKPNG